MNVINILLLVSIIANLFVLIAYFIMLIKERNNGALDASHQVLYAKMMTITDKLNALLKNLDIEEDLDIEEEEKTTKVKTDKVAHITKINGNKADFGNAVFVSPQNIEQLRGHDFSVIHIDEDCIRDIDLKLFYDILIPIRAKNNTIVDFCCYKDKR